MKFIVTWVGTEHPELWGKATFDTFDEANKFADRLTIGPSIRSFRTLTGLYSDCNVVHGTSGRRWSSDMPTTIYDFDVDEWFDADIVIQEVTA